MNIEQAWLPDSRLAAISRRPLALQARSRWQSRYVPSCPSECYRGAATVMTLIIDGLRRGQRMDDLVDEIDRSLQAANPANGSWNDRNVGAGIANTNAYTYGHSGYGMDMVLMAMEAELICTAGFYFINKERGIRPKAGGGRLDAEVRDL
jgi:hypothetical protein